MYGCCMTARSRAAHQPRPRALRMVNQRHAPTSWWKRVRAALMPSNVGMVKHMFLVASRAVRQTRLVVGAIDAESCRGAEQRSNAALRKRWEPRRRSAGPSAEPTWRRARHGVQSPMSVGTLALLGIVDNKGEKAPQSTEKY